MERVAALVVGSTLITFVIAGTFVSILGFAFLGAVIVWIIFLYPIRAHRVINRQVGDSRSKTAKWKAKNRLGGDCLVTQVDDVQMAILSHLLRTATKLNTLRLKT
jgi:hypothetical protein